MLPLTPHIRVTAARLMPAPTRVITDIAITVHLMLLHLQASTEAGKIAPLVPISLPIQLIQALAAQAIAAVTQVTAGIATTAALM